MQYAHGAPRGLAFWVLCAIATIAACRAGRPGALDSTVGDPKVTGAACSPGQVRDCGIEIGTRGDTVDCMKGTQTCSAQGGWGECVPLSTHPLFTRPAVRAAATPAAGTLRTMAFSSTASACVNNPCNPDCMAFSDVPDAAIVGDSSTTTIATTGPSLADLPPGSVPGGFISKGAQEDLCTQPCTSASCQSACQFDHHCSSANTCVPFSVLESGACTGIDITTPVTCNDGSNRLVSVCNRGTVTAPTGIKCYLYPGNSPQYPDDDPGLGTLLLTTTAPIDAGRCETHSVPDATFGANGTRSIMCNPPGSQGTETTVEYSIPNHAPTTSSTFGTGTTATWSNLTNAYAQNETYATATLAKTTTTPAYPSSGSITTTGWTSPGNAAAADGLVATATPTAGGGSIVALPTSNVSGGWVNPTNVYASGGGYATASLSAPALGVPTVGAATFVQRTYGNGCNAASCTFTDPSNVTADEVTAGAPSAAYARSTLGKNQVAGLFVGGIDTSAIPSTATLTKVQVQVRWRSTSTTRTSLGVQPYVDGTATYLGTEATRTVSTASTWQTDTLDFTTNVSQLTLSDLSSTGFLRIRAIRNNQGSETHDVDIDWVKVSISYQAPPSPTTVSTVFGSFGISIPAGSTIDSVQIETTWKASAANANVSMSVQALKSGVSLGSALTTSGAPPTTDTTATSSIPVTGLTAADLADGTFTVRLTGQRAYSASDTSGAVTASVDHITVRVTYSSSGAVAVLEASGFGINLPAEARIESVTTEARWRITTANANAILGMVPRIGGGAVLLGTETTTTAGVSPPTSFTTATHVVSGAGLTPSDLTDANFSVRVRASRGSALAPNPDFTAELDYVRVTVAYTLGDQTVTARFGGFGFVVPTASTITSIVAEVKWRISTPSTYAVLGAKVLRDNGATEVTTAIGTSPPTTDTVITVTDQDPPITPEQLLNESFVVDVRATRLASDSLASPDFTAYIEYVRVTVNYEQSSGGNIVECNPHNNWTVSKANPGIDCQPQVARTYEPFLVTRVFQATCASAQRPVWKYLAYDSTTPAGTSIQFRVRNYDETDGACSTLTAVTTSPPTPVATATLSPNTQTCSLTAGTTTCPVDLFTALGGSANAMRPCLQLDAYGTTDGSATAQLRSWDVTYDCVAAE